MSTGYDKATLGAELGRLRLARGYTLSEVAEVLNVSKVTVYNWVAGKKQPSPSHAEKIERLIKQLKPLPSPNAENK